jgi:hypothetical protein
MQSCSTCQEVTRISCNHNIYYRSTLYEPTKCSFFNFTFYLQIDPYIYVSVLLKNHHQGVQNYIQSTPIYIHSAVTSSSVNL